MALSTDVDVVVVGAGITGLALTHALATHDVDSVTFETEADPGGVIKSQQLTGGLVVERGPNRIRLTDEIAALIDVVDLRDSLIIADDNLPLYVYADGRLREVPFNVEMFLRTDLLSWLAKLRIFAEPFTKNVRPDESVGRAIRQSFGTASYRNIVEPIFGGTYGSNPDRMPVEYALPALLRMQDDSRTLLFALLKHVMSSSERPPPVSIEGGLQRLPNALAARYAERINLSTPVTKIECADAGYHVITPDDSVTADHVVLTVPAPAAAELLTDTAPDSADALDELRYNPLAVVTMSSDVRRDGYGYQVQRSEPPRTLGVSWHHSLFDRTGQYTAFFGGMDDPSIVDESSKAIGEIATEEFEIVMGATAHVHDVARFDHAIPAYDTSWYALENVNLPDGITLATNYTARVGVPGRIREAERIADRLAEDILS